MRARQLIQRPKYITLKEFQAGIIYKPLFPKNKWVDGYYWLSLEDNLEFNFKKNTLLFLGHNVLYQNAHINYSQKFSAINKGEILTCSRFFGKVFEKAKGKIFSIIQQ